MYDGCKDGCVGGDSWGGGDKGSENSIANLGL